jgi:hypothetical protein
MKYATVEYVIASFPKPVLPKVQGEPDYQTIHAIRKSLQANLRAIATQIQDRANYSEAGGVLIGHPPQINVG